MVIATQNPVEHHGTYPLPESQLDRFLMRLADRLSRSRERARDPAQFGRAFRRRAASRAVSRRESSELQDMAPRVTVDPSLVDYMLAIVASTRSHDSLALGVSPRGSQALYRASQALA